jgi:superfamily I DNA/RNA helicase
VTYETPEGVPDPNLRQRQLVGNLDGTVLCDAGAGTGKTFTVANRYLHILEARDATPRDVLLITFTRNAAEEMRERILALGEGTVTPGDLRDAPISTFHALANRLLEQHGFRVPAHLGLEGRLAPGFDVVGDDVLERERFEDFLRGFLDAHPQHADLLRVVRDPGNLLDLLRELAAKGIFPTRGGWYRDGRDLLEGDREAFLDRASETNASPDGNRSEARKRFWDRARGKLFHPPDREREDAADGNRLDPEALETAFDEDREALVGFLHDIYVGYLEDALDRNTLNFPFLLLFAYVLLVEDDDLREDQQVDHVMIDEFQDTSEIQLQLALLYCGQANLCCVGDWKQSIYRFQYASVDNILDFEHRLAAYARRLNRDRVRVPDPYDLTPATRIPLELNYRSTQDVLDLAPEALTAPATRGEDLDEAAIRDRVTELSSTADLQETRLGKLACEDEVEAVLARVQRIVGSEDHRVRGEDGPRVPTYGDVAVLTRTRAFALELQERAKQVGLPVAFEGGVELYRTDAAKLVLAWLRLLEDPRSRRGWAPLLELAGYTLDEAERVLDERAYPDAMLAFRQRLTELPTLAAVARAVFDRYGVDDGFAEALVASVQSVYEASDKTLGGVVRTLEDRLEEGTVDRVDDHPGGDVVTVQTIHAAKGLEYPIVVLADVNESRFPSTGGGPPGRLRYDETPGLRSSKTFADDGDAPAYVYESWAYTLLDAATGGPDYDEERRLLYVALSRAEQHLYVTAEQGRESRFFEHLPLEAEQVDAAPDPTRVDAREAPPALELDVPAASRPRGVPVRELVPEPEGARGGRGRGFGRRLHGFAARYALGDDVEPTDADQEHVACLVDEHRAEGREVTPELDVRGPVEVDGTRAAVEGTVDLLAEGSQAVHVIDWKTAPSGEGLDAYRVQVGLYAWIAARARPGKRVQGWIVYTEDGRREPVEPLAPPAVADRVGEALDPP